MSLDEAGFMEFAETQRPALVRLARAVCLNWADADDVAQEALVRVGLRWRRLSRSGHPHAYARTVVTRLAVDQARRRTRERAPGPTVGAERSSDDPRWVEEAGWIRSALEPLPPQQRAAIALRYLADRSDQEIADHIGCSTSTVRSHISRGLEKIRTSAVTSGSSDA